MSEMIERAAKAMCASQLYGSAWDGLNEGAQETYRANARACLLAALDPEDEALVRAVQDAIAYTVGWPQKARAAIAALRNNITQGEQT